MTIFDVTKMWSRNSGYTETTNGRDHKLSFSEGWQVSHSFDATEPEILSASGLPVKGDLLSGTFAWCRKVGPTSRLGPGFSIVQVDYLGEGGPGGVTDSPLNQRPKINWRSRRSSDMTDRNWYGRPITTVNGETINGITLDLVDQTLTVERNFALFSPHLIHPYLHSSSSDIFKNYAAGLAKLQDYSADEESANGFEYWKVSAVIDFRYPYNTTPERAWFARILHQGLYERIGSLLTFTGGGGSGAAGHAVINSSGVITAVVVTNGGKDYETAPTVTVADGTGAAFLAYAIDGRVGSVDVLTGGTGYRTKVVRAVDSNKEPTQQPVLLKLDGSREYDENNAIWLEERMLGPLPYAALGLV